MMRYEREKEIIKTLEDLLQREALNAYENGLIEHARYKANCALRDSVNEIGSVFGGDSHAFVLVNGAIAVTTKFMIKNEDITGAKMLSNGPLPDELLDFDKR